MQSKAIKHYHHKMISNVPYFFVSVTSFHFWLSAAENLTLRENSN